MLGDKTNSSYECLNDVSTKDDMLGFRPYVEAITEFLTAEYTHPPITLSIEGQWGCGKSSFMKQLQEAIDNKNKGKNKKEYFTVWFNSWKYEKEDELWASFALNFTDELSKQLSWRHLQQSRLKLFYLRYKLRFKSNFLVFIHFSWNILCFTLIFSFLTLVFIYVLHSLGMPLPSFISDGFIQKFSNFVLISAPFVGLMKYFSTEKWFIGVFRDPLGLKKLESNINYKDRLSFREHFHSDLNEIIKAYIGDSKVYVFIDDLDRCEVPKAAELMQAINLMVSDNSKVYFSLAIDRKIISAGIAAKNERVINYLGVEGIEYGYDFIEKFIQLPFKVPSPKSSDFLKFLISTNEAKIPSNMFEPFEKPSTSEGFNPNKYPERSIKSLGNQSRGQENGTYEPDSVKTILNKQKICYRDYVEDFETSKLILEMVSPALDNNPRRIKQFINQFRFQRIIGERTGLFSYDEGTAPENMWNCKKLAKFVAISIKWNSLIYALNSNRELLTRLQEYVHKPENGGKNLERWAEDEKLIELLRYGYTKDSNILQSAPEYTLSGLDFSNLLQISPLLTNPEENSVPSFIKINDIEFVLINKGEFMIGSLDDEIDRSDYESPSHKVMIKNSFYLGRYPVTQKQWIAVMGNNPSRFKGDNLPVESVSWDDIQEFIKKINKVENTEKYRLPSEAEWEYACRAGKTTRYYFGDNESELGDYAWYYNNSGPNTHPVGQKKPNPWGLYDMHGNVWEWVQDRWHSDYNGAPSDSKAWEDTNNYRRVVRGGGWYNGHARNCRSAARTGYNSDNCKSYVGFRLLREL